MRRTGNTRGDDDAWVSGGDGGRIARDAIVVIGSHGTRLRGAMHGGLDDDGSAGRCHGNSGRAGLNDLYRVFRKLRLGMMLMQKRLLVRRRQWLLGIGWLLWLLFQVWLVLMIRLLRHE